MSFEKVAATAIVLPPDGGGFTISWWAPAGSDWRPTHRPQAADELHVHIIQGQRSNDGA